MVELPRRRGDEKEAALREKEGLRSLVPADTLDVVGMFEVLLFCDSGGRGAGILGMEGIVESAPSRVVGLNEVAKEAEEKMSAVGGGRCMVKLVIAATGGEIEDDEQVRQGLG